MIPGKLGPTTSAARRWWDSVAGMPSGWPRTQMRQDARSQLGNEGRLQEHIERYPVLGPSTPGSPTSSSTDLTAAGMLHERAAPASSVAPRRRGGCTGEGLRSSRRRSECWGAEPASKWPCSCRRVQRHHTDEREPGLSRHTTHDQPVSSQNE